MALGSFESVANGPFYMLYFWLTSNYDLTCG